MTGSHTSTPQRGHPPATPWRSRLLRRWPETTVLLMLLGLSVWTIRLALRERGAGRVWAAITLWVVMGIPGVLDRYDRAHGHPLPPPEPQMAVDPVTATTSGGDRQEVAGVLCGLAALGYDGIAAAVRVVREHTGLNAAELAIQVGLPPVALVLWEQGSFIPRTHHLLRLATVLAASTPTSARANPPSRPDPTALARNTACDMTTDDRQGAPTSDDPADRPDHQHPRQHHGG